jgi:uncharacterized membrane protein
MDCAPAEGRRQLLKQLRIQDMTSKTAILIAAVGTLVALAGPVLAADDSNTEKCYGVAKAAKNDCAGAAHACAGQAAKDGSTKEFVKLPKGTCERLVGGSLTSK